MRKTSKLASAAVLIRSAAPAGVPSMPGVRLRASFPKTEDGRNLAVYAWPDGLASPQPAVKDLCRMATQSLHKAPPAVLERHRTRPPGGETVHAIRFTRPTPAPTPGRAVKAGRRPPP